MRHRFIYGKVGSFDSEAIKVKTIEYDSDKLSEEVEEIFEEETELRGDDEALESMEYFDSPDQME